MRDASAPTGVDARESVAQLYEIHREMLVRLALLLCADPDAAEEIVQDAFAALQQNWCRPHAYEAALDYLRKSIVNGTRQLRVTEPPAPPHSDFVLLLVEEHRAVTFALRELPRRQREVLVLRYWSELGETDIAVAMGVSRRAVRSTASRALAAVRTRLVSGDPETRVRAALRAGAEAMNIADRPLADERLDYGAVRNRRVGWPALLTTAVALAGTLAAVLIGRSWSHRTGPVVGDVHPATCRAANATVWLRAITTGAVYVGDVEPRGVDLQVLGVDGHGEAIAVVALGTKLVAIGRDQSVRTIYTLHVATGTQPKFGYEGLGGAGSVDRDWVAFAVNTAAGGGNHVNGIYAVNAASGTVRVARPVQRYPLPDTQVQPPVVVRHVVYWSEQTEASGFVYSYDLSTGARQTLWQGANYGVVAAGGGVYWFERSDGQLHTHLVRDLPPGFVPRAFVDAPVTTDGRRTAWLRRGDGTPGSSTDVEVRTGAGPVVRVAHLIGGVQTLTIAGPYLIWYQVGEATVLDMRTGATATYRNPSPLTKARAGGRTLAMSVGAHAHRLAVVDVARLPELHC
jgi:RNA polymerase sigma factor (sigma-70 family)